MSRRLSDGRYEVFVHDGATAQRPAHQIVPLGVESQVGDAVVAIFDDRAYAFQGTHESTHADGRIYVAYADGDKKYTAAGRVHKLQTLGRCGVIRIQ